MRDSLQKTVSTKKHLFTFINTVFNPRSCYCSKSVVNKALRAENSSSLNLSTTALSNLVLPVSWHEVNTTPTMDWDKWTNLFQVAIMAKYSISLTELTREVTQQTPRTPALIGDMDEDPANKKVVCVMYLSLEAARKQFKNKYPNTTLWDFKAVELLGLTNECFQVKWNRTLDHHRLFFTSTNRSHKLSIPPKWQ